MTINCDCFRIGSLRRKRFHLVSVRFQSKERPRNGILGLGRTRDSFACAILILVPRSLLFAKPHGKACYAGYRIGYKSIKSRIVF